VDISPSLACLLVRSFARLLRVFTHISDPESQVAYNKLFKFSFLLYFGSFFVVPSTRYFGERVDEQIKKLLFALWSAPSRLANRLQFEFQTFLAIK
jgi:hypothetical protein